MSEETNQPNPDVPDVVRSPKNTDRDSALEGAGKETDGSETVRELVILEPELDDSPKNDRPADLTTLAETVDQPEVVRGLVVLEPELDDSPKNDRD